LCDANCWNLESPSDYPAVRNLRVVDLLRPGQGFAKVRTISRGGKFAGPHTQIEFHLPGAGGSPSDSGTGAIRIGFWPMGKALHESCLSAVPAGAFGGPGCGNLKAVSPFFFGLPMRGIGTGRVPVARKVVLLQLYSDEGVLAVGPPGRSREGGVTKRGRSGCFEPGNWTYLKLKTAKGSYWYFIHRQGDGESFPIQAWIFPPYLLFFAIGPSPAN